MVKICDSAIKKPLSPIHKILLKQVYICSNAWKKVQHCPIKQIVNNNRPGSLLPIFVKFLRKSYLIPFLDTFKRIVFSVIANQVFNLIHVSINSITLTEYGMKGSSTKWKLNLRYASKIVAKTFFKTDHWVLLHGHCSSWAPVFTGVPQGSLLGPFFFNLHKWLINKRIFHQPTICRWYLQFFYCKWYWYFWTWVEHWSEEKIFVCLSMEDVLQSRYFKAGSQGNIYSLKKLKNYSTQLFCLILFMYSVAQFKSI